MRDRRWLNIQQSTSTQSFSCQGDYSTTLQIGNLRNPVKNCLRRYPKCLPRNSPKLLWASWWGEMFWPRAPFKPKKKKKTRPGGMTAPPFFIKRKPCGNRPRKTPRTLDFASEGDFIVRHAGFEPGWAASSAGALTNWAIAQSATPFKPTRQIQK